MTPRDYLGPPFLTKDENLISPGRKLCRNETLLLLGSALAQPPGGPSLSAGGAKDHAGSAHTLGFLMVRLLQGYLVKNPLHGHILSQSRKRFFVLTDDTLEWCDVIPLVNGSGRQLAADRSPQVCGRWES